MVSWLFYVPSPNGDIVAGRSKGQFGLSDERVILDWRGVPGQEHLESGKFWLGLCDEHKATKEGDG